MTTPLRVPALVAGAMLATTLFVAAQTPPEAPPPYRPGLGDLMTMTVQPRHIKLALAGREKNWVYAAYELHQLDEDHVAAVAPSEDRRNDRDHHQAADVRSWLGDQG